MCDNSTNTIIENRDRYIIWLAYKLREMAADILHFATYDDSDVDTTECQYKKYVDDSINFIAGAHACEKYLYGSLDIDEFCAEMINEKLKSFVIDVPHLPNELVVKYGLVTTDDDNADGAIIANSNNLGIVESVNTNDDNNAHYDGETDAIEQDDQMDGIEVEEGVEDN